MKTTFALLALFIAILVGGYLFSGHPSMPAQDNGMTVAATAPADNAAKPSPIASPATAPNPPKTASYTSAQVAAHSTSRNCWTSIQGNVYDLTNWISQHPGGEEAILSICGKDGTQAFEGQHGSASDTRPKEMLATFKIGTLAS